MTQSYNFNAPANRHGTFAAKFDKLASYSGLDQTDGLGMWIADSDYGTAPVVLEALQAEIAHGMLGYGYDDEGYRAAVQWWLGTRHNWQIDPSWIVTTQGLGHAIASCIDLWSEPGERVCYFTPVYHEFRYKTERAGRVPVELPMALVDGRYQLDWDAANAAITPDTRVLLFCNPQNPSGRIWTADEQREVAAFAAHHDLLLISDEVHCDVIYGGATHTPMDIAAPEHRDRTVTLFAASKTFNLAGLRTGQAIIPDATLRDRLQQRLIALNYDAGTSGIVATKAAFSPEGQDWATAQLAHLDANRKLFDDAIAAIPGLWSMPLQSTFLAWVDFSRLGMTAEEVNQRLSNDAKIAPQRGEQFGTGNELWNRFNFATPRSTVEDAIARLQRAFGDIQ